VRRIAGDGIELAVIDEGDGPPVLLLHGFPDTAALWRHQIAALTAAGFRAIAPDLRGRGESGRPETVEGYAAPHSVADMIALLDVLGVESAAVVAHDFGAVVGWLLAEQHPQRVQRLVAMSVGHPRISRQRTMRDRERAWYQLLFQFEGIAEELLQHGEWRLFREWLRGNGDADAYIDDLARPGALTAGLNWYRANLSPALELARAKAAPQPPARVEVPVLGMWSTGDDYLGEERMVASAEVCAAGWRYERIEDASHWMQLDQQQLVNELLLDFLGATAGPAPEA